MLMVYHNVDSEGSTYDTGTGVVIVTSSASPTFYSDTNYVHRWCCYLVISWLVPNIVSTIAHMYCLFGSMPLSWMLHHSEVGTMFYFIVSLCLGRTPNLAPTDTFPASNYLHIIITLSYNIILPITHPYPVGTSKHGSLIKRLLLVPSQFPLPPLHTRRTEDTTPHNMGTSTTACDTITHGRSVNTATEVMVIVKVKETVLTPTSTPDSTTVIDLTREPEERMGLAPRHKDDRYNPITHTSNNEHAWCQNKQVIWGSLIWQKLYLVIL